MAVEVKIDLERRQALAEAAAEIMGIGEAQFVSDGIRIEHDIRNAPRMTVEVTKFLSAEEYDRLFGILHG